MWDWITDLFSGGGGEAAADVAAGAAADSLPLPPEWISYEDAMAGVGSAAGDSGGGFWDSAGNWIANNSGSLIRGVTALGGTLLGQNANNRAAQTSADATFRAAQLNAEEAARARAEMAAARDRGIAAIRAGTAGYADTIAPLLTERPVMLPTHRGLTRTQEIAREDLLRQGRSTLATSGLRGAGRAGVAALMDTDRRFLAGAADRNDADRLTAHRTARVSADNARSGLAQIRAQEGGSIANTEIGQGNRMADNIQQAGTVTANATQQAGQQQANAGLANAALWNDAIGTLGSVFAGATKEANRDRYEATGSIV